jgi:hypothetical protein
MEIQGCKRKCHADAIVAGEFPQNIDIARDQIIFRDDHHRIAKFEQDFQAAPGQLLFFSTGW